MISALYYTTMHLAGFVLVCFTETITQSAGRHVEACRHITLITISQTVFTLTTEFLCTQPISSK